MEQFWDIFKRDLEDIKDKAAPQSEKWWNDKMVNFFQYAPADPDRGVIKIGEDAIPRYEIVDDTKKIIKFSATKQAENGRVVSIKVAKDDNNGNPVILSQQELNAAKSFVDNIQTAGLFLNVVSFQPDQVRFLGDIYYNAQYVKADVEEQINNAIREYLQNLKFDGTLEIIRLIDRIQLVEGVEDIFLTFAGGTPSGGVEESFSRIYNTLAGYATYNEQGSLFNYKIQK